MFYVSENYPDYASKKIDPGTDTNDSSVNVIHFNAYNAGVVEDETSFLFFIVMYKHVYQTMIM